MAPPEAEIVIDVPLDEAWAAITDADELSAWFGADVELDAEPLGKGTFRFADGSVRFAIVEEVDVRTACRGVGGRRANDVCPHAGGRRA